jgi:hypothetical protein
MLGCEACLFARANDRWVCLESDALESFETGRHDPGACCFWMALLVQHFSSTVRGHASTKDSQSRCGMVAPQLTMYTHTDQVVGEAAGQIQAPSSEPKQGCQAGRDQRHLRREPVVSTKRSRRSQPTPRLPATVDPFAASEHHSFSLACRPDF